MWWMFLIVDVASKCPSCLCSASNQLNIPSFPACDYVNTQHFPTKENINIGPVLYQGSFHQDTVGSNAPQLVQGSATSINFVIAGHFTWLRVVIWGWTRLGMLASCPLVTGIQDARSFCFGPWFALLGGKSTTSHTSLHITDTTLLQQISRTLQLLGSSNQGTISQSSLGGMPGMLEILTFIIHQNHLGWTRPKGMVDML